MQGIGSALHKLVKDWHNVAVRVFDAVKTHGAVFVDHTLQVGRDQLGELAGAVKWVYIEAIIRTQRKAVQQPGMGGKLLGCPQRFM